MTENLVHGFIWAVLIAAVVAAVLCRVQRCVRVLSVLILLWFAGVVWVGVMGSSRVATGAAHRDGVLPTEDFGRGAQATRDEALKMTPVFVVVVLGLSLLAVVPVRPNK